MPTTTNLGLPYPSLSDAPNGPQQFQDLAAGIDGKFTVTSYTPTLTAATTNPVLGTGSTIAGRYALWGKKMITVWGRVIWGSSGGTAGTGQYFISLPAGITSANAGVTLIPGSAMFRDDNAGTITPGACYVGAGATNIALLSTSGIVGSGTPWTWANLDYLAFNITFEIA